MSTDASQPPLAPPLPPPPPAPPAKAASVPPAPPAVTFADLETEVDAAVDGMKLQLAQRDDTIAKLSAKVEALLARPVAPAAVVSDPTPVAPPVIFNIPPIELERIYILAAAIVAAGMSPALAAEKAIATHKAIAAALQAAVD